MGHVVSLLRLMLMILDLNLSLNLDRICICNLLALLYCWTATYATTDYLHPYHLVLQSTYTPAARSTSAIVVTS